MHLPRPRIVNSIRSRSRQRPGDAGEPQEPDRDQERDGGATDHPPAAGRVTPHRPFPRRVIGPLRNSSFISVAGLCEFSTSSAPQSCWSCVSRRVSQTLECASTARSAARLRLRRVLGQLGRRVPPRAQRTGRRRKVAWCLMGTARSPGRRRGGNERVARQVERLARSGRLSVDLGLRLEEAFGYHRPAGFEGRTGLALQEASRGVCALDRAPHELSARLALRGSMESLAPGRQIWEQSPCFFTAASALQRGLR